MSKYNNKKVELDCCIFDSEAESKYYDLLKEKQSAGEVQAIELQPTFVLQPGYKKNGKRFDAITYKAEFMLYLPNGDVKGEVTDTFSIEKKMFEYYFLHLSLVASCLYNVIRTKSVNDSNLNKFLRCIYIY
ncbi:DUF1064 domain-containing protein [Bacillus sp. BC08]